MVWKILKVILYPIIWLFGFNNQKNDKNYQVQLDDLILENKTLKKEIEQGERAIADKQTVIQRLNQQVVDRNAKIQQQQEEINLMKNRSCSQCNGFLRTGTIVRTGIAVCLALSLLWFLGSTFFRTQVDGAYSKLSQEFETVKVQLEQTRQNLAVALQEKTKTKTVEPAKTQTQNVEVKSSGSANSNTNNEIIINHLDVQTHDYVFYISLILSGLAWLIFCIRVFLCSVSCMGINCKNWHLHVRGCGGILFCVFSGVAIVAASYCKDVSKEYTHNFQQQQQAREQLRAQEQINSSQLVSVVKPNENQGQKEPASEKKDNPQHQSSETPKFIPLPPTDSEQDF